MFKFNTYSKFNSLLVTVVFSSLLTSCATVFNSVRTPVKVVTNKPAKMVLGDYELRTDSEGAELRVLRSNKPLKLTVTTDSVTRKFIIKPFNSIAYWADILYTYGIGLYVERNNPRRYTYPRMIYINMDDTTGSFKTYHRETKKGQVYFHVSVPYANAFYFQTKPGVVRDAPGYLGISMGADYFYSKKQYLSFTATNATNFEVPIIVPLDHFFEYERIFTDYLSLSNNHILNRFSVGYGLVYAINTWEHYNPYYYAYPGYSKLAISKGPKPEFISYRAVGLMLNSYFNVVKGLNVGVIYRPTFYRLNTPDHFKYEHFISLDVAYKVPVLWPWAAWRQLKEEHAKRRAERD